MRAGRSIRGGAAAACLLAALLLAATGGTAAADDDPLLARVFEIRYRPLADAAELVGPMLSPDGSFTVRMRLKMLVVEDRVSVLDRIQALLASYDLPPLNAEITFSLALGTDRRRADRGGPKIAASEFSREVRGVMDTIADFTKWTDYEPLGSRSVIGSEGGEVTADLSDQYRVVFNLESVRPSPGEVKFSYLVLQRIGRADNGSETVEEIYRATVTLAADQTHVFGAAKDPDSNRALFLIMKARVR